MQRNSAHGRVSAAAQPPERGVQTILVVEPSRLVRDGLCRLLCSAGYAVREAATASDALRSLNEEACQAAVIEIGLPIHEGLFLLKSIRARDATRGLPVVVLSEIADRAYVLEVMSHQVSSYMLKSSFDPAALVQRLRNATRRSGEPESRSVLQHSADERVLPPAALLRDLKPITSHADINARLDDASQLRAFSPTVTMLLELLKDPACSVERLVRVVSQDQAIALKILKLANSSAFARGGPVQSIHKAVLRIGMEKIRDVVVNIGLIQQFDAPVLSQEINFAHFWEHGIACGVIAAELAIETGALDSDAAFTVGLLHDVGRLICAEGLGAEYSQVLETAGRMELPLEQVESRLLGVDHAALMERVLPKWHLPKHLIDPIATHHLSVGSLRRAIPQGARAAAVVGLANRMAHALMLGSSGNSVVYPTEEHCSFLGIDEAAFSRIADAAMQQTRELRFAMMTVSSTAPWPEVRDCVRQEFEGLARPHLMSAQPGLDAFRLFFDTLWGGEAAGADIGVMHVAHEREAIAIVDAAERLERARATGPMTWVVAAPAGMRVPESFVRARQVRCVPQPCTVRRLARAMQRISSGVIESA